MGEICSNESQDGRVLKRFSDEFMGYGADNRTDLPSSREISLVDIVVRIWRQKRPMLVTFLAVMAIGVVFVATRSEVYQYSTVIEIGSYVEPDVSGNVQNRHLIERPERVKSKLEKHYILSELLSYGQEKKSLAGDISEGIVVSISPESNMVEITVEGTEARASVLTDFLSRVNENLMKDHRRLVVEIESKLLGAVEEREASLSALKSEVVVLQQNKKLALQSRKNLAREKDIIASQVGRYLDSLKRLRVQREKIMSGSISSDSPITPILLETEISDLQKLSDEAEIRGEIEIPGLIDEVDRKIAIFDQEIKVLQRKIQSAQNALMRSFNAGSKAEAGAETVIPIEATVDAAELVNLTPTKIALQPFRSLRPVSLPLIAIFSLAFVVALFLAFVFALATDFVQVTRKTMFQNH